MKPLRPLPRPPKTTDPATTPDAGRPVHPDPMIKAGPVPPDWIGLFSGASRRRPSGPTRFGMAHATHGAATKGEYIRMGQLLHRMGLQILQQVDRPAPNLWVRPADWPMAEQACRLYCQLGRARFWTLLDPPNPHGPTP